MMLLTNLLHRATGSILAGIVCCLSTTASFGQQPPLFDANSDTTADSIQVDAETETVRAVSGTDATILWSCTDEVSSAFGAAVQLVPDMTGDGVADVLVAAPAFETNTGLAGAAYLVSGAAGTIVWATSGSEEGVFGSRLSFIPDQDRDGKPEIIISVRGLTGAAARVAVLSGDDGHLLAIREGRVDPLAVWAWGGGLLYTPTDLDDSGMVDAADIAIFTPWLQGQDPQGDLNRDGQIGQDDLDMLVADVANGLLTIRVMAIPPGGTQQEEPPLGQSANGGSPNTELASCNINPLGTGNTCAYASVTLSGCTTDHLPIGASRTLTATGAPEGGTYAWFVETIPDSEGRSGQAVLVYESPSRVNVIGGEPGRVRVTVRYTVTVAGVVCVKCESCEIEIPCPCQSDVDICDATPGPNACEHDYSHVTPIPERPPPLYMSKNSVLDLVATGTPGGGVYGWLITEPPSDAPARIVPSGNRCRVISGNDPGLLQIQAMHKAPGCCPRAALITIEVYDDADADGIPDPYEFDEGLPGARQCPDRFNADSDGDGFNDGLERRLGTSPCDPLSKPDVSTDTDRDGLTDFEEAHTYQTNPLAFDSDNDGVQDLAEIELGFDPHNPVTNSENGVPIPDAQTQEYKATDTDSDGIYDPYESAVGFSVHRSDQDQDGIRDGLEMRRGLDPTLANQGPACPDDWVDTDGDGITNAVEILLGTSPNDADSDGDGVSDGNEARFGMDPNLADSDHDGVLDGDEDFDGDGLENAMEELIGTDPGDRDTDDDGFCDSGELERGDDPTGRDILPYDDRLLNSDGTPSSCRAEFVVTGCGDSRALIKVNGRTLGLGACPENPLDTPSIRLPLQYGVWYEIETVTPCGTIATAFTYGAEAPVGCDRPVPVTYEHLGSTSGCPSRSRFRVMYQPVPSGDDNGIDTDGDGHDDRYDFNNDGTVDAQDYPPTIDLDIDSDNNDGILPPRRTIDEEDLEVEQGHPGKILMASTWDSDGDNIPDYADGYGLLGSELDPHDLDGAGYRGFDLIPVHVAVTGYREESIELTATYEGSDPDDVGYTTEDLFTLPSGGNLRLWALLLPENSVEYEGNEQPRGPLYAAAMPRRAGEPCYVPPPIRLGGAGEAGSFEYLQPGVGVPLSRFVGAKTGRITMYLQAVAASPTLGQTITMTLSGSGCASSGAVCEDVVKVTAIERQILPVNSDGTLGQPSADIPTSHPTPVVTVSQHNVLSVSVDPEDPTQLLATIQVVGSVADPAADLIPGEAGVIRNLAISVNGELVPITPDTDGPWRTIELQTSKSDVPASNSAADRLLRPHPYSGSFSQVLTGIPVSPGLNEFALIAVSAHGTTGFTAFTFAVHAEPPPDEDVEVQILLNEPLPLITTEARLWVRSAQVGQAMGAWPTNPTVLERSNLSAFEGAGITLTMHDWFVPDSTEVETCTATLEGAGLSISLLDVDVTESGASSLLFMGAAQITDDMRTDYTHYALTAPATEVSEAEGSEGGIFEPFVYAIAGPPGLLPHMNTIEIAERRYPMRAWDTHYLLGRPNEENPLAFIAIAQHAVKDPAYSPTPPANDVLDNPNRMILLLTTQGKIDFMKGFGSGLWDTGVSVKDGAVAVFDIWWHYTKNYSPIGYSWRALHGDTALIIESDAAKIKAWGARLESVGEFVWDLYNDRDLLYEAIVLDKEEALVRLYDDYGTYIDLVLEIQEAVIAAALDLTPRDLGWIAGRVTGEIAIQVVPMLLTFGSSAVATSSARAAQILAISAKIASGDFVADAIGGTMRLGRGTHAALGSKIAPLVGKFDRLLNTRMCFIAGTLIWTVHGPVPIECLRVGDLVLSQSEDTGEWGFKPVLDTITTHPAELWKLTIADKHGTQHTLTGTAEHPIWTTDAAFVPMAHLKPGQQVLLADGAAAWVHDIRRLRGPPEGEPAAAAWGWNGDTYTTFNIEVQDFHTYFAGDAGVWVHNVGEKCRQFFRIIDKLLDEEGAVTPSANDTARGRRPRLRAFELAEKTRLAVAKRAWQERNPGVAPPTGPDLPWDDMTVDSRREFVLGHSEEIIKNAKTDAGIAAPEKTNGYDEWNEHFDELDTKWNRASLGLEVNHGVPRHIMTKLKIAMTDNDLVQSVIDDVDIPAFPFKRQRHGRGKGLRADGAYEATFHDLLEGNANRGIVGRINWNNNPNPGQIRRAIKLAYEDLHNLHAGADDVDYRAMGELVDKFLESRGVH